MSEKDAARPRVDLEPEASGDLNEIYLFFLNYAPDVSFADAALEAIRIQLLALASNSMISGLKVAGLEARYRLWYVLERKYKVYFERIEPNYINVLRIYSSRKPPLKPREILRSLYRPIGPTIPKDEPPKISED